MDLHAVNGGVVSAAIVESHPGLCVAVVPDKGRSFFTMEVSEYSGDRHQSSANLVGG